MYSKLLMSDHNHWTSHSPKNPVPSTDASISNTTTIASYG